MASTADDHVHVMRVERIGGFAILERIGRGAMGVVYRARDEATGGEVAIKVLGVDLERDREIRARFRREAEAAAHLSHPNIITVYHVGEDGDRPYIVMELLRGSTLKNLPPDALPLDRKLDLMIQLCAGLGAAHRASIFHRDIKPGNVFVRTDGVLKILDFGVARLAGSGRSRSGVIVGTPDYMSPEQVRGAEIDRRSDIFAAGGVFYFMLTGRKPFPAGDIPTLFHQIQRTDPCPIDGDVPADLVSVVLKALSKSRDARYQTCEELSADLETVRHRHALRLADELPADPGMSNEWLGPGSIWTATPADVAAATDDTADLPSAAAASSAETATIPRRWPWASQVAERIDRALSHLLAPWRRANGRTAVRRTPIRKR